MRLQTIGPLKTLITAILLTGIVLFSLRLVSSFRASSAPNQGKPSGTATGHLSGMDLPTSAGRTAATLQLKNDEYQTTQLNDERAAALVLSSTTIDTSGWKTFSDPRYGYEFKYPPNWTVNIPSSGYVENEAVQVVNPAETRVLEDYGLTYYTISVAKVWYDVPILLQATSSEKKAKILLRILSEGEFQFASLSRTACNVLLIYNIRNNPNDAIALFTDATRAYEIAFSGYYAGDPSKEDAETFRGIYSSFKLLKQ